MAGETSAVKPRLTRRALSGLAAAAIPVFPTYAQGRKKLPDDQDTLDPTGAAILRAKRNELLEPRSIPNCVSITQIQRIDKEALGEVSATVENMAQAIALKGEAQSPMSVHALHEAQDLQQRLSSQLAALNAECLARQCKTDVN